MVFSNAVMACSMSLGVGGIMGCVVSVGADDDDDDNDNADSTEGGRSTILSEYSLNMVGTLRLDVNACSPPIN